MSFNRSNTGRASNSVTKNSSSTSSKNWKENIANLNRSPTNRRLPGEEVHNLRQSSTRSQQKISLTVTKQNFNKTQNMSSQVTQIPLSLNLAYHESLTLREAKLPLQENQNFKSENESWMSYDDGRDNLETKAQLQTFGPRLRLQTSPEQEQAAEAVPQIENFDMIRQLISPTAEDTRTFLEQISLQLRNLPKVTSDNSSSANSTRYVAQPNDLKALDLSRISHEQRTNFEDLEEGFNNDTDFSRGVQVPLVQHDKTNNSVEFTQNINELPLMHQDILSERSLSGQENSRSFRLNLLNSQNMSLKNQFDYASLIDRRQSVQKSSSRHSLKNNSCAPGSQQASERHGSIGHPQTYRTNPVAGPILSKGNSDNKMMSLDQLVGDEDMLADLVYIVNDDKMVGSAEQLQMTSRFKPTRTVSVATFGQQGNYGMVGGQSCTSPTTNTLSPSNAAHQIDGYWRREEKMQIQMTNESEENSVTSKNDSVAQRHKNQGGTSQSIVNKFINAAYERQNKSSQLTRPVLDHKKRCSSQSSRNNLRISTQASECLSSRRCRIGPSTTSQMLSQLKNDNKLLERSYQKAFQKTETFSSADLKVAPDSNERPSQRPLVRKTRNSKGQKKSDSKSSTKKTSTISRLNRTITPQSQSQQASSVTRASKQPGGTFPKQSRFNRNSVNILHSQQSTVQKRRTQQNETEKSINRSSVQSRISRRTSNKSPQLSDIQHSVEKRSVRQRASSRKSHHTQQPLSILGRKLDSRVSSRMSNKSPMIPELELNKSIVSAGVGDLNEDLIKFIDQTEDDKEEPALSNLRKYQTRLVYVGSKIDHYARFITLRKVREFSFTEKPQSTAYLKAGRSLCLLLKAFTCMDESFRQIKEDELFADWPKIQQYLNSEQGEKQIKKLSQLRQYCEMHSKFSDKKTLLVDLRKSIFKYTLETDGSLGQVDLESPRVKTAALKPIFCLAFFTMTYITLQEQIRQKLQQLELISAQQLQQQQEPWQEQSAMSNSASPDKSQGQGCSPDVNRLGIANIAISTTDMHCPTTSQSQNFNIRRVMPNLTQQRHFSDSDQNQMDHFALIKDVQRPKICRTNDMPSQNIISPVSNSSILQSKEGNIQRPSNFFNQVQGLDMFGSNFKPNLQGTPQKEEENVGLRAAESWSRKAANDQLNEYVMQPICSIEQPTSSSLLQQSNSGAYNVNSTHKSQGGGLPDHNNSLGGLGTIGSMTNKPVQHDQSHHQTSEFTFYQSQKHLVSKMSQQQLTNTSINNAHNDSDLNVPPQNNSFQQTFNAQLMQHAESWEPDSPDWQEKDANNNELSSVEEKVKQSPSFSEHRKISNILFEQRNADGINVKDLISQVRSSQEQSIEGVQAKSIEQHMKIEHAFEKFYKQQLTSMDHSDEQKTTAEEDTILNGRGIAQLGGAPAEQPSNSWQVVGEDERTIVEQETQEDEVTPQKSQVDQIDAFWASKRARTSEQILHSIKKRRMNAEDRVTGVQLESLADQIIEQCRASIERVSVAEEVPQPCYFLQQDNENEQQERAPTKLQPQPVLEESDGSLVQCLFSKKLIVSDTQELEGEEESFSRQHVFMSPETPTQEEVQAQMTSHMKRVFASTEYKFLGRASYGGGCGNEARQSMEVVEDEMKVAYRIPEVSETDEVLEVEDVFKTLEAREPKHIQEVVTWLEQ